MQDKRVSSGIKVKIILVNKRKMNTICNRLMHCNHYVFVIDS